MLRLRKYIVLALLSIFVVATTAGVAMAHCDRMAADGHASMASMASMAPMGDMAKAGDMAASEMHQATAEHACHDDASEPAGHSGPDAGSTTCLNCVGSLCQSPTLAPLSAGFDHHRSTDAVYFEEHIHIHSITLAIIPDPPRQLS